MYYVVTDEPYGTHIGNSVSTERVVKARSDFSSLHINLAAENALSASTEAGSTVNKYL